MVRAMVHSTKHYIQVTLTTASTGAKNDEIIIDAAAIQDVNVSFETKEGNSIKAVYMEMWAIGSVSDQFFTAIVYKAPSGLAAPSFTNMTNLFAWDNKKNILYTTQGLASNDGIAAPIAIYKGWIKIPKSKQRFGLGDRLIFSIASRGSATITYCGFFTYKEYS